MSATPANLRRRAMLEALDYLEYRIAVCRDAEEHFSVANGHPPISSATERAARHELELAVQEIAKLANMQRRSRAYREITAERARYVARRTAARRAALTDHGQGEGSDDA